MLVLMLFIILCCSDDYGSELGALTEMVAWNQGAESELLLPCCTTFLDRVDFHSKFTVMHSVHSVHFSFAIIGL